MQINQAVNFPYEQKQKVWKETPKVLERAITVRPKKYFINAHQH